MDLSYNLQRFIKYVYKDINKNDLILCKKFNGKKIDFVLSVNSIEKNISLKNGDNVCIYRDRISNLILFLLSLNVSKDCLLALLHYQYADGTFDGSGNKINSCGQLLKVDFASQIDIVNREFENKVLLSKFLDNMLFYEKNGMRVDYFYCGDCRNGIYACAYDVKNNILNDKDNYKHEFMRLGIMNFIPLKRSGCSVENNRKKHFCILRMNIKKYIKTI